MEKRISNANHVRIGANVFLRRFASEGVNRLLYEDGIACTDLSTFLRQPVQMRENCHFVGHCDGGSVNVWASQSL